MSTYIYAITPATHPLRLDGLSGVGDPPSALRTVTTRGLGAVVSDAPPGLRAKRRDLVAHQGVLERLMSDGAVLPMRFGVVGPDDEQVSAALAQGHEQYRARLAELDGRVEYNLKVARAEESVLREVLADSADARRLREHTQRHPEARDQKMALGELVAREVSAREEAESRELTSALGAVAERVSHADPTRGHFLNVSFLVKRHEAAVLSQAVDEESERRGEAYEFTLNGPLPPYSFA